MARHLIRWEIRIDMWMISLTGPYSSGARGGSACAIIQASSMCPTGEADLLSSTSEGYVLSMGEATDRSR